MAVEVEEVLLLCGPVVLFTDSTEAVLSFLVGNVGVLDEIVDGVSNGPLIVRIDADAAVVMLDDFFP